MPNAMLVTKRIHLTAFSLLFLAIILLSTVLWVGSTRLIVPNRPALEQRHYDLLSSPAEFGLMLENLEFRTHDDFKLSAILAERAPTLGTAYKTREMLRRLQKRGVPSIQRPRGTILILHGRGGRKEDMLSIAQRFVAADFRCLVYDARAHGQSEGVYCTFGKNESLDLQTVLKQTADLLQKRKETIGPVGIFGISLGASVALQSAEITRTPSAMIVVSPFTSLPEIVHYSGKRMIHSLLPHWVSRGCLLVGGWRANFDPESILPLEAASRMKVPLFLIHGERDKVIPISHGREIFSSSGSLSKQWRSVETGYHGNVLAQGGDDLYEEMALFYLQHLAGNALAVTVSE